MTTALTSEITEIISLLRSEIHFPDETALFLEKLLEKFGAHGIRRLKKEMLEDIRSLAAALNGSNQSIKGICNGAGDGKSGIHLRRCVRTEGARFLKNPAKKHSNELQKYLENWRKSEGIPVREF